MPSSRTRHRVSFDVSADTFTRFNAFKETHGFEGRSSGDRLINHVLTTAERQPSSQALATASTPSDITPDALLHLLNCTESERDEIAQALTVPYTDFWRLAHAGLLREVRITNTNAAKLATLDLSSDSDVSKNRVRGSSYHRIAQVVDELMANNLAAKIPLDRLYITKGIVSDQAHVHSDYVASYFEDHADELAAHHHAMGFTSHMAGVLHNRRRARSRKVQAGDTV